MYGYVTVDALVRSGAADTVVLVGVERLSWVMDYTDRGTCILFGDGAGAVVMQATDLETGVLGSVLGVDGTMADILCVPNDGTVRPGSAGPETRIVMEGSDVFRRAVTAMADASESVVRQAGWEVDDIDLLVPHQANQRIIDATARRLKLDLSRVFLNIHAYGNTSAATIPIALTEAIESGRVPPRANLVFAAFGGGLTWGGGGGQVRRAGGARERGGGRAARDRPVGVGPAPAQLPTTSGGWGLHEPGGPGHRRFPRDRSGCFAEPRRPGTYGGGQLRGERGRGRRSGGCDSRRWREGRRFSRRMSADPKTWRACSRGSPRPSAGRRYW